METEDIVAHIRKLSETHRKDCSVLVPAEEGEPVVAYWRPDADTILLVDAGALLSYCPGWLDLGFWDDEVDITRSSKPDEELSGTPLTALTVDSYPHSEENWAAIAPSDYKEWMATTPAPEQQPVMDAWVEYMAFYQSNEPFHATDREVFAVVGGWGLYLREGEWADCPDSESILFTLADAEPYYSVRQTPNNELVLKELIS